MTVVAHPPTNLAELRESWKEELIQRWAKQVKERLHLGTSNRAELVDSLPDFLSELRVYGIPSLGPGLFITRQIVLGHGGGIGVRSTLAEGTTFTVRMPRRPPSSGAPGSRS